MFVFLCVTACLCVTICMCFFGLSLGYLVIYCVIADMSDRVLLRRCDISETLLPPWDRGLDHLTERGQGLG